MEQIRVADYGIYPDKKDPLNTLRLRSLLDSFRRRGNVEIIFDRGEYHFYPDFAREEVLYISNHDEDALKRIAFDLTGFSNLKLRGEGSDFVFHTELLGFHIHQCEHVSLEGFTMDYDRPAYSEAVILEVKEDRMKLFIDKEKYPYKIAHHRIFFEGENFQYEIPHWIEFDSARCAPVYEGTELGFEESEDGYYGIWSEAEDGMVEVVLDDERYHFGQAYKKGNRIILRHHPRSYPAIYLTESKDITFENIDIYHCAGMGIVGEFSEDITMHRVNVKRNPKKDRLFSAAADGAQFVYCGGLIRITHCLFENQLDDAVNIHGIYTRIKKVISDREVLTELVHHQHKGVKVGEPGNRIAIVDKDTMFSVGETHIERADKLNRDYTYVRFTDSMSGLEEGRVLENLTYAPDVQIEDCIIQNNRARGILLTSAGRIEVRRNIFRTAGATILIEGDAGDWFESGATKDVNIEENVFDNCAYVLNWGRAPIQISTNVHKVLPGKKYHKYMAVKKNHFICFDKRVLNINNLETLVFEENTVETSSQYAPHEGEAFVLQNVDHSEINPLL